VLNLGKTQRNKPSSLKKLLLHGTCARNFLRKFHLQRRSSHQGSAQRSVIDSRIQWREQGACATKNILSAESARMLPQMWAWRSQ
jgi:hypothetical protein